MQIEHRYAPEVEMDKWEISKRVPKPDEYYWLNLGLLIARHTYSGNFIWTRKCR